MCLMLYVGTAEALATISSADLHVEDVEPARLAVVGWFSAPAVRFIGAHTGCSCGFPSVMADVPIEYYEGMPLQSDNREADLRSVRALLDLLRRAAAGSRPVELYPIADGDEATPPKGVIQWQLATLDPARFFFSEGFMHVVSNRPAG